MKILIVVTLFFSVVGAQVDYNSQIQTIFTNNCTGCHGGSGGLNLSSYDELMKGGNSGAVIKAGQASNLSLIHISEPTRRYAISGGGVGV